MKFLFILPEEPWRSNEAPPSLLALSTVLGWLLGRAIPCDNERLARRPSKGNVLGEGGTSLPDTTGTSAIVRCAGSALGFCETVLDSENVAEWRGVLWRGSALRWL